MNVENEKCVIVVGNDVLDLEGNAHMGIIQFPVPILKGNTEILKKIRTRRLKTRSDNCSRPG